MSMMKGFSNVFRIPELRKKIMVTLGLVFVCRLISQVPLPGIDWAVFSEMLEALKQNASMGGGLINMFDTFTGGALGQCSIGTLSIWPYISAQIVIQLLSSVIPSLEKYKKEGETGRQQLAQITRYLTIVLCVGQAFALAMGLENPHTIDLPVPPDQALVLNPGLGFRLLTVITVTTASLFVMWVADQITTFGIGNGASLIIMINITSRLPKALQAAWERYFGVTATDKAEAGLSELVILLCLFLLVVWGTVMLVQGVRKVMIHSTRRSVSGGNMYGMQQTYMPLRVNYTGVMPIIFAQPLLQVLGAVCGFKMMPQRIQEFGKELMTAQCWEYYLIYGILILFFTFFWVATQFNAVEISENLKKDGSYVPGVRPGRATAEYLDDVMTKITLIGGVALLVLALIPPTLSNGLLHLPAVITGFFGGTSLLIIVGVALDTLRVMESHLLVRKYDGFLEHGTLRGRGGV